MFAGSELLLTWAEGSQGEVIVYQWSADHPLLSVDVIHSPHFWTWISDNLWGQLANLDQILCVVSLGWGKGYIRFWGRFDQNWFPWQQKLRAHWLIMGKTMSPPFLHCFYSHQKADVFWFSFGISKTSSPRYWTTFQSFSCVFMQGKFETNFVAD